MGNFSLKSRTKYLMGTCAGFALCALALPQAARAQTASDETTNQSAADQSGEDIVVTATKRSTKLLQIPFGISAIGEEKLEQTGATSAATYLAAVPSVHYTDLGHGRSPIVIRGISTEGTNVNNLQPTVEIYMDELPLMDRFCGWTYPNINTFDVERVEVLRGPQGTLFGSGAMGGAIRLISNHPNMTDYQAKVEVGGETIEGGGAGWHSSVMVNIPLISDKLALRLVGIHRSNGGFVDNTIRNEKNVNSGTEDGIRAILAWTPTPDLAVRLTAFHEVDKLDDSAKTYTLGEGPAYKWNGIIPEASNARTHLFNLSVDYNLGFANLTSTTTYGIIDNFLNTDFIRFLDGAFGTGVDPKNNTAWIRRNSRRIAQEFRLASNDKGPLEWTVGAFYMHYHQHLDQLWELGPTHAREIDDAIVTGTDELAIFGEATYHISDQFSVTAGARKVWNHFQLQTTSHGILQSTGPLNKVKNGALTPRFSVSFYPEKNVHLYVTASKGYRVGQTNFNYNLDPVNIPRGFNPDSLWNYEAGIKATWFDNRLTTNLTAFRIDWSNIQLQRFVTLPSGLVENFTGNGGKARVRGIEAEFIVHPSSNFELGSSLTLTDGKLRSVQSGVALTPGSRLPGSPKFAMSNYAQVNANLSDKVTGYLRLSHDHVGKVYGDINNSSLVLSDSYNKLDLRMGFATDRYELAFYVDNLANSDAVVSRQDLDAPPYYGYRLKPRTEGVTFRANF
jgi:iron complex outermembrane recepter protein